MPRTASKKGQSAFLEFPVRPALWLFPYSSTHSLHHPPANGCRRGKKVMQLAEEDEVISPHGIVKRKKAESKQNIAIKDQKDLRLFF